MFLNICLIMSLILFFNSIIMFYLSMNFMYNDFTYFIEFNIFSLNSCSIIMTILLDWMSLLFLSIVFLISSSVIYYSKYYMELEIFMNRFIILVLMFVFSMMLLIISPNLISILLGWDGLGLISYCLVIYYQNIKSFNAGMLTVLSNRIGDVFMLMSIAWMINFGSWDYIFFLEFFKFNNEMNYILIFILLASFTKSAQIPFSSWLPAAMAAPTPVSSLVHSSTLVTAGVYLLIRFEKLFFNNNFINLFLLISILTMFMSGLNAIFEYDLKKIIALSTLSQLGLMLSILFLGFSKLAFFHLLMHALFKALLFMCAGIFIHNLLDFQDIRYMGCVSLHMPFVSLCFNFANLALCGFPFLAGFYSKDMILEMFFMTNYNLFVFFMFIISSLFTVIYTFRLIYYLMINSFNMLPMNYLNEISWGINKSLMILMFMVIFFGGSLSWLIFPYPSLIFLPFYMKILPICIIIFGIFFSYILYKLSYMKFTMSMYFMKYFLSMMWFLPFISTFMLNKHFMIFSKKMSLEIDQNWTENIMGRGFIKILKFHSLSMDLLIFRFNNLLTLLFIFMLFWWGFYIFI